MRTTAYVLELLLVFMLRKLLDDDGQTQPYFGVHHHSHSWFNGPFRLHFAFSVGAQLVTVYERALVSGYRVFWFDFVRNTTYRLRSIPYCLLDFGIRITGLRWEATLFNYYIILFGIHCLVLGLEEGITLSRRTSNASNI
jgi:hypothetical protein